MERRDFWQEYRTVVLGNRAKDSLCPSINEIVALISFQSRNEEFSARSRKSRDYAEAYFSTSHK